MAKRCTAEVVGGAGALPVSELPLQKRTARGWTCCAVARSVTQLQNPYALDGDHE